MSEQFDFIVVGGGSAGAVIASRLSEDPACRVALIEAGERPPEISSLPIAPPAMQLNPATDWMYTADPGKAGLGLNGQRVPVPRRRNRVADPVHDARRPAGEHLSGVSRRRAGAAAEFDGHHRRPGDAAPP